jgi:antagonist of KipI
MSQAKSFTVIKNSPLSRWIDQGRPNLQHLGIPQSGPLDKRAFEFGHKLLGLNFEQPSIEYLGGELEIHFNNDFEICISGFGIKAFIQSLEVLTNSALKIKKGASLKIIPHGEFGRVAYLSFKGKLDIKTSGFKHFHNSLCPNIGTDFGTSISKGKEVYFDSLENKMTQITTIPELDSSYIRQKSIRVYQGPEFDLFSKEQIAHFFGSAFTISTEMNSFAFKLEESLLDYDNSTEITSSGVLPGTIQINNLGKPMLLHRDCQTTGGYPRIGVIHPDDLDILAQKRTGDRLFFRFAR